MKSLNKRKNFKLKLEYSVRLVSSIGTCLATDKITVEGMPVGFMYRDYPLDEMDSGWRFIAGVEDEAYMNNPENLERFDINVIANHDKSIVDYINLPHETKLQRIQGENKFIDISER